MKLHPSLLTLAFGLSLAAGLTGCGGGSSAQASTATGHDAPSQTDTGTGGNSVPAGAGDTASSSAPTEKWIPYGRWIGDSNGQTTALDNLTLDALDDPASTITLSPGTLMIPGDALAQDSLNSVPFTNSGIVMPTVDGGYRKFPAEHLLFWASGGQIYRADLTAQAPEAQQMGQLGLTQLCSLYAGSTNSQGSQGQLLVSGLTTSQASSADCQSGNGVKTWILPYDATASTRATPLTFNPQVRWHFSDSQMSPEGYLITVDQHWYLTQDLSREGQPVTGFDNSIDFATATVKPFNMGTEDSQFVQVSDANGNQVYRIDPDGTATRIQGLPDQAAPLIGEGVDSHGIASHDADGDLFLLYYPMTQTVTQPISYAIYKVPVTSDTAQEIMAPKGLKPSAFQASADGSNAIVYYQQTAPSSIYQGGFNHSTAEIHVLDFQARTDRKVPVDLSPYSLVPPSVGVAARFLNSPKMDMSGNWVAQTTGAPGLQLPETLIIQPKSGALVHSFANTTAVTEEYVTPSAWGVAFGIGRLAQIQGASSPSECAQIQGQTIDTRDYSVKQYFAVPSGKGCQVSTIGAYGNYFPATVLGTTGATSFGAKLTSSSGTVTAPLVLGPQTDSANGFVFWGFF